jgi:ACS family hexuronate transporter-like MFS transporter
VKYAGAMWAWRGERRGADGGPGGGSLAGVRGKTLSSDAGAEGAGLRWRAPEGDRAAWVVVAMVTAAIAISYFDRQTLPVAIDVISRSIAISNRQYSWLQTAFLIPYALLYVGGGRLLDRVGTRRGFAIIMAWWSAAAALHGFARGFGTLLGARLLLGMGEGGGFPAATRIVSEWLPAESRATAMGIINAGTAVGSVAAPPLIGLILWKWNWPVVFFASGAAGGAWVLWWAARYRDPAGSRDPAGTIEGPRQTARAAAWGPLLRSKEVWVLVSAKFLSDSAWYFYLFWLPKYLYDARGFDLRHVGYLAWIPYAASGFGSFLGGWLSSALLARNHSLDFARKAALGASAFLMPGVILVPHVSTAVAFALFSLAFFGQQSWSGLIMTLPADTFPLPAVGTVAGLVGFGGAIGGAVFSLVAGQILSVGFTYTTIFSILGTFHVIAFAVILLGGRLRSAGGFASAGNEAAAS